MPLIITLIIIIFSAFQGHTCELAERKLAQLIETRRQALHHSLSDAGVSIHAKPIEVRHVPMKRPHSDANLIDPLTHKVVMTREYIYEVNIPGGEIFFDRNLNKEVRRFKKKIVIQEHSYGHNFDGEIVGAHFNIRPFSNVKHGEVPGTLPHYLFEAQHSNPLMQAH